MYISSLGGRLPTWKFLHAKFVQLSPIFRVRGKNLSMGIASGKNNKTDAAGILNFIYIHPTILICRLCMTRLMQLYVYCFAPTLGVPPKEWTMTACTNTSPWRIWSLFLLLEWNFQVPLQHTWYSCRGGYCKLINIRSTLEQYQQTNIF